ncbi:MAG: DUF3137 domain-containing protein [Clostridia bacterium]
MSLKFDLLENLEIAERDSLTKSQKKLKMYDISFVAAAIVLCCIMLMFTYKYSGNVPVMIFQLVFPLIAVEGLLMFLRQNELIRFLKMYKTKVVPTLLKRVSPHIIYSPDVYVMPSIYDSSSLKIPYDKYLGEDYVAANLSKNNCRYGIEMSQITLQKEQNYKNSHGKIRYISVFKGVFVHANLTKAYPGTIKIISNESAIDSFSRKLVDKNQKVNLDSPQFEEVYDVYSNDQINVRRMLTPANMSDILDITKALNVKIEMSIEGSNMYISFKHPEFLDFYSKKELVDEEKAEKDLDLITKVFKIVDTACENVEKLVIE